MQTIPKVAKRTLVTMTAGFMWFTASANADVSLSFNTLPSNQGWTYESAIGTKEQDVFSVNGAAVHQNSLRIFDAPNYRMNGVVQRAPFDLQFRARATAFDVPNNPLGFTVLVGAGDFLVYFGMAQGFVELEENVISTVDVAVDTSQFHDYRIIGDPGAGSYRFFIDGTQRLSR